MRNVCANIRWLSYAEGGRKTLLPPGAIYYPHIVTDQPKSLPYSVRFTVTPIDLKGNSTIIFSMLADNKETNHFFSQLCVGMTFKLTEGNVVVAVGSITDIV